MPQNPGYKAIAVVSLMLLAGVPFANPEAARDAGTLSTFSDGSSEVELAFPEGGGWNNSTSVTVPAGVRVTGANVTLGPGAVELNGSLGANATELAAGCTLENLTLRGENLTLADSGWWWGQDATTGFTDSVFNGTQSSLDGVILAHNGGRNDFIGSGGGTWLYSKNVTISNPSSIDRVYEPIKIHTNFIQGLVDNATSELRVADETGLEIPSMSWNTGYWPDGSIREAEILFVVSKINPNNKLNYSLWYNNSRSVYPNYKEKLMFYDDFQRSYLGPDWSDISGTVYPKGSFSIAVKDSVQIHGTASTGMYGSWIQYNTLLPQQFTVKTNMSIVQGSGSYYQAKMVLNNKGNFFYICDGWMQWATYQPFYFFSDETVTYTPIGTSDSDVLNTNHTFGMKYDSTYVWGSVDDINLGQYKTSIPNPCLQLQVMAASGSIIYASINSVVIYDGYTEVNIYSNPLSYFINDQFHLQGDILSPPITTPLASFDLVSINISLPEMTGYDVDILDTVSNMTLQAGLHSGDRIVVDPTANPSIRMKMSLSTSNGNITPVLHSWGFGTSITNYCQKNQPLGNLDNITLISGMTLSHNQYDYPIAVKDDFSVCSSVGEQWQPHIATDSRGNFIITWCDSRNGNWTIYSQRYDAEGNPIGTETLVCSGVSTAIQNWPAPEIITDSNDNYIITWHDTRNTSPEETDIYARAYDKQGNPLNSIIPLVTIKGWQVDPKLGVLSNNNIILVWEDNRNSGIWDIYARCYNLTGYPLGDEFIVCSAVGDQRNPSVAVDLKDNVMITWQDNRNGNGYDIYARRFNSVGNPLGGDFAVSNAITDEWYPEISVDSHDNIFLAWYDNGNNGGIYAKRYDQNGTAIGTKFSVRIGAVAQIPFAIAIDSYDNCMIAWTDGRTAVSYDIYGQRFDANGQPIGSDFAVSTASNHQLYTAMAISTNDMTIVTWHDNRNGVSTNYDVYTKILTQPYFQTGTYRSQTLDLGSCIMTLVDPDQRYSIPINTTLNISIRSSNDTINWSSWENVQNISGSLFTPALRYMQWKAELHSMTNLTTPIINFFRLNYTVLLKSGSIVSAPFHLPANLTHLIFTADPAGTYETLITDLSFDGGTTWIVVDSGSDYNVSTISSDNIIFRAIFKANSNFQGYYPEIHNISIDYTHSSIPSEIQIVYNGCHATLRPYQQETLADIKDLFGDWTNYTTAQPETVTLSVYSATAGTLRLSNLTITYETSAPSNNPPVISNPSPPDNSTVNTTDVLLDWSASDADNDTLSFELLLNGSSLGQNLSRPYQLLNLSRGATYSWQIRAFDTHEWADGPVWHFTISETAKENHPPTVQLLSPPDKAVLQNLSGLIYLEWSGSDTDLDQIYYTLYIDERNASTPTGTGTGTNATLRSNNTTAVTYYWRVEASDGKSNASSPVWSFTYKLLTNRPPAFLTTDLPRATAGKDYRFRLAANDPDNDSLVFTLVSGPEGMTIDPGGNLSWRPPGGHTYQFTVNVTDGVNNVSKTFDLAVKWGGEVGPPPFYMTDEFPAFLIVVLAVIGIITGLIVARSRKPTRSRPSPETTPESIPDLSAQTAISIMSQPIVTPSIILPGPAARTEPAAPQPIIDDIFLVYRDGRLISHNTRKLKPDSDDSVLASMFTAVQEFVKDSFAEDESAHINEISYGENKILIEHGKSLFMAAVVSGEGTRRMHEQMKAAVYNIEQECSPALVKWSGEAKELKESKKWIKALIDGQNIETAATTPAPVKAAASPIVAPTQAPRPPVEAATTTPPASSQQPEMGSLPLPEELVEEEAKTMPKTVQKPITTPPATAAPAYWETALGGGNVATPSSPPKAETVPGLPAGATRIVNPFREETMALKTLSNIPRGLPGSLSGRSMDELAEELVLAQFAESADGDIIVKLGKKWYFGDPKQADTYLQPYKQS